jgi:hypothetical protein
MTCRAMKLPALFLAVAVVAGAAWLPSSARADDDRSGRLQEAEHARISDEMDRLAERKAWTGVDRLYRKLETLQVEPSLNDYMLGAYASRELGEVIEVRDRLKSAARTHQSKEIVEWLWKIDNTYGRVELVSVPPRSTTLEAGVMPFDPDQRKAVEAAIRSVSDDGMFVGMLPEGEFTFSGQQFKVEPGISVRIEVSPRVRRHGPIAPVIVYPDGKPVDASSEAPPHQETP